MKVRVRRRGQCPARGPRPLSCLARLLLLLKVEYGNDLKENGKKKERHFDSRSEFGKGFNATKEI